MGTHGSHRNHRMRRGAVLWCACCLGVVAASAVLMPGCIQDPAARAELTRLMLASKGAQETVKDAFSRLDSLVEKLKPLKAQIAAAWGKLKSKELPAAEAAAIINTLTQQKESILAEISLLKQDIVKGKAQFEQARASAEKLRSEFNISPWIIGGTLLLSLLGGATGTGLIAKVANGRIRAALSTAQQGLRIVTGALETASPDTKHLTPEQAAAVTEHHEAQRKAVKKQIAGTDNDAIEEAVAEARRSIATDTVNRTG